MGRNAGFLTAASILARQRPDDGPHLVYLPERPFDIDQFVKDVEAGLRALRPLRGGRLRRHRRHARASCGPRRSRSSSRPASRRTPHGNIELSAGAGSLADYLAGTVRSQLQDIKRVRADTFGYLQRSFPGFYSEVDAWEARLVGQMAVSYSLDADHGRQRRPGPPAEHDLHRRHQAGRR